MKFTVNISGKNIRVNLPDGSEPSDAVDRAIEKTYGKSYGFQKSSDDHYRSFSEGVSGTLLRAAKGGGAHCVSRESISVSEGW